MLNLKSLASQFYIVTSAVLIYFGTRSLTEGDPATSFKNAEQIIDAEKSLGIYIEPAIQSAIVGHDFIVTFVNWIYIWGHWPVIIAVLIWLYIRHNKEYVILRNAIFISGLMGMVIFALYPVAPPRFLPEFTDTITQNSNSYRVLQPPSLSNIYAAFPSLHFGWNLLAAIAIFRAVPNIYTKILLAIGPILMLCAIVFTANHYILDAVGGGVLALSGLYLALNWKKILTHIKSRYSEGSVKQ